MLTFFDFSIMLGSAKISASFNWPANVDITVIFFGISWAIILHPAQILGF